MITVGWLGEIGIADADAYVAPQIVNPIWLLAGGVITTPVAVLGGVTAVVVPEANARSVTAMTGFSAEIVNGPITFVLAVPVEPVIPPPLYTPVIVLD